MFLVIIILPLTLATQTDFETFKYKIRHYARLDFFGYILCKVSGNGSNSADLSDRLANLMMISVEH